MHYGVGKIPRKAWIEQGWWYISERIRSGYVGCLFRDTSADLLFPRILLLSFRLYMLPAGERLRLLGHMLRLAELMHPADLHPILDLHSLVCLR